MPLAEVRFEAWLTKTPIRLAFAGVCLVAHLAAAATMGTHRFSMPFNAAPGSPPAFVQEGANSPQNWNRLVVSRWDSEHYIALGLRGFSLCPTESLRGAQNLLAILPRCQVNFYPAYSICGRIASLGGRVPIDSALLAVSLAASFAFLFLWTGPSLTRPLGIVTTYLAAILFNAFTTGFTLVTIQTEPLVLALTLGAFVALDRRAYLLGALLAGAASGIRVSGVATGLAYAVALAVVTRRDPPRTALAWARRGFEFLLSGWCLAAIFLYFWVRFGDPLLYVHAHSQSYGHELMPKYDANLLLRSLDHPLHPGMITLVALIFLLLGMRDAMKGFDSSARAFWYTLTAGALGVSMLGSFGLSLEGMNRYLLLALPLFFSMAVVMKRRPLLVPLWLTFSLWHYWEVDLCLYVSGPGDRALEQCNCKHWVGRT